MHFRIQIITMVTLRNSTIVFFKILGVNFFRMMQIIKHQIKSLLSKNMLSTNVVYPPDAHVGVRGHHFTNNQYGNIFVEILVLFIKLLFVETNRIFQKKFCFRLFNCFGIS